MVTYNYALVITGTVEAPNDVHAKQQVLMGVTITTRMLQTPHDVVIQLQRNETPAASDLPTKEAED